MHIFLFVLNRIWIWLYKQIHMIGVDLSYDNEVALLKNLAFIRASMACFLQIVFFTSMYFLCFRVSIESSSFTMFNR